MGQRFGHHVQVLGRLLCQRLLQLGYKGKATSDGLHEVARVTQLLHL